MTHPAEPSGLTVDCARLRADPTQRIEMRRRWVIEDAALTTARVADGSVLVDVTVKAVGRSFVADGRLEGVWEAECRRCLGDVRGPLRAPLREAFEDDHVEGETWPVFLARIDLAQPVRECALLALPMAPLCSPDCAGPDPDRFPTGPAPPPTADEPLSRPVDPRWAALDQITFDA